MSTSKEHRRRPGKTNEISADGFVHHTRLPEQTALPASEAIDEADEACRIVEKSEISYIHLARQFVIRGEDVGLSQQDDLNS